MPHAGRGCPITLLPLLALILVAGGQAGGARPEGGRAGGARPRRRPDSALILVAGGQAGGAPSPSSLFWRPTQAPSGTPAGLWRRPLLPKPLSRLHRADHVRRQVGSPQLAAHCPCSTPPPLPATSCAAAQGCPWPGAGPRALGWQPHQPRAAPNRVAPRRWGGYATPTVARAGAHRRRTELRALGPPAGSLSCLGAPLAAAVDTGQLKATPAGSTGLLQGRRRQGRWAPLLAPQTTLAHEPWRPPPSGQPAPSFCALCALLRSRAAGTLRWPWPGCRWLFHVICALCAAAVRLGARRALLVFKNF